VRRAFGKRRKQLHFSDKQRRCDKCNTFLSKDNHQFCGTCINCITESQGTNETRSNAERRSNEEVVMVETVESDDDSASATSADNEEESAEPFELLLSCDNCH
jgi:hypothetical protein